MRIILADQAAMAPLYRFLQHEIRNLGSESIAGAALANSELVTWGDRLLSWSLPRGDMRVLISKPARPFAEGGCLMDVDQDGHLDIVLNNGSLTWFQRSRGTMHQVASSIEAQDVIPATLHEVRGVLLVQKRNQVRFYEIPGDPRRPWQGRDIYSFYSPSEQGGLLLADINDDGLTDIVCGNYWIQSPSNAAEPWRLFAINTWSEERLSGISKFALLGAKLVVAQGEMPHARLAYFEKPPDPHQLWIEHRLDSSLDLNQPHAQAVADFDDDGQPEILVGERAGRGRLIIFRDSKPHVISESRPIHYAQVVNQPPDIIGVGRNFVSVWENRSS